MNENALARIQSSLRAASSRRRDAAHPGPFLVTLTRESDNPYLNYAIPDDGAEPTPEDVEALVAAFGAKKPRFEYVPQLAPAVEPALLAAGFVPEARTPLMVYQVPPLASGVKSAPIPEGLELVEPQSDEEVRALLTALNEAYGGEPPSDEEVVRQRARLDEGWIALLVRNAQTHEPAGGGLVVGPEGGVAEVAGIGVRETYRRRGLAVALVSGLTELALERGVQLPFLMAATDAVARVYARAGYETVGEVLHISR